MIAVENARTLIGEAALVFGSLLIVLAAVGVVRFPDPLTRVHALGKASTLGASLALLGVAITMSRVNDVMSLLFAAALQAGTNPVASTLLVRAIYDAEGIPSVVDKVDELGSELERKGESEQDGTREGNAESDGAATDARPPGG